MRLNEQGLVNRKQWEEKGYNLPKFDREAVTAATKDNPFWIHFGPGNIFRAFQANVVQNLLNEGLLDRGIVAAEGYDYEIIACAANTRHGFSEYAHHLFGVQHAVGLIYNILVYADF